MLSILDSLTVSFEANDMALLSVKKSAMLPKYGYMHTEISIVIHNGIIQMKLYSYRAAII